MNSRMLVVGLGVLLILVSTFADAIGIGQEARFGWKQWAGIAVGIVIVAVGVAWSRLSR